MADEATQGGGEEDVEEVKETREKPRFFSIGKTNNEEEKGGEERHEIGGNENIAKLFLVPRVAQQVFST
jgi:hypothetical protein